MIFSDPLLIKNVGFDNVIFIWETFISSTFLIFATMVATLGLTTFSIMVGYLMIDQVCHSLEELCLESF